MNRIRLGAAIVLGATAGYCRAADHGALPWPEAQAIVDQVKPPVFADRRFPITDFGAVGDARTDNTAPIARAIDACAAAGGGHVIVPSGTFLTGAINIKSKVDLHLETGAILQFSDNPAEFPPVPTRYQCIDLINRSPAIYANNATDIGLTGDGILDGTLTQKWNKGSGGYAALQTMEKNGVPIEKRVFDSSHAMRTVFVEPNNCTNVLIQGITVRNANFWQLHPLLCTNVIVDGVTTYTTTSTGNTDGCDPEGCKNVVIENCTIGAGDDCIAIKAGRNPDTQRDARPCENIVIMHSKFHGTWGLITLGSEITDGVQHVYAYDLATTAGPGHGGKTEQSVKLLLYMKSNKIRGGFAKDVHIDSVTGKFSSAIVNSTLVYEGVKDGPTPPKFDDITLSHVTAQAPMFLDVSALADDPMGSISLSDCAITGVTKKSAVNNAPAISYKNVTVNGEAVQ